MQSENTPKGLGPFGTADDIAVQRGIAEFQAGRPVAIADADETIVALPVDGRRYPRHNLVSRGRTAL